MRTSVLLDEVMLLLGNPKAVENDIGETPSKQAQAIASFVKNHRINVKNVFEVVEIMWPEAEINIREKFMDYYDYVESDANKKSFAVYDIIFKDGSQGVIISWRGIGEVFELVA